MLEDNFQEKTQIYVCDINPHMLNVGKMRAQEGGNIGGVLHSEKLYFLLPLV